MKKWKKISIITGAIILALIAVIVVVALLIFPKGFWTGQSAMHDTRDQLEQVAWRHDLKPLQSRFDNIKGMEKCYWKADTIGSVDFGPTNYYIKGFIVLDQAGFEKLKDEYSWEKIKNDFPQGLKPEITGFQDFDWAFSQDFSNKVLQNKFGGALYLDLNNGVVYISVENL